jgi:hypothetical protein
MVWRWRLHSCRWRAAQCVRYHVLLAWCVSDVRCEFGDEGELALLAGRPQRCGAEQGRNERLVVGVGSRVNCRPSSKNLKCLTALKAASSSLSKVEYMVPAPDSFLE